MMIAIPLLLLLAATQAQATPDSPDAAVRDRKDLSADALVACGNLPVAEQPACIEPFLDQLPVEHADLLRTATDPKLLAEMKAWEAATNEAMQARARALAARGTSRDLLAAVMASPMRFPGKDGDRAISAEVAGWFAAARTATPADPLVAWVEATDCKGLADDCDQAGAVERLLRVDAGNAAAHLLAASRSASADDTDAVRAHVARAAAAPRFEPYDQQLLELMFATQQEIEWPRMSEDLARLWGRAFALGTVMDAEEWGVTNMMGYWMAMVNPTADVRFCMRLPNDASDRYRADCRAVLEMLANDDALINQRVALPTLVAMTAGTSEGAHWRERLRQLFWLLEEGLMRAPGNPGSEMSALEYVRFRVGEGEVAGLREFLRRIGRPERAPADWQPDNPFHRQELDPGS